MAPVLILFGLVATTPTILLCNQSPDIMEKIDETRPLRRPDADLQPLWPRLRIRTAHDDIDANHKNSRNRNHQSRCRPGQSVCDPADRSSRHRGPLPEWQDRSVVLAAGT